MKNALLLLLCFLLLGLTLGASGEDDLTEMDEDDVMESAEHIAEYSSFQDDIRKIGKLCIKECPSSNDKFNYTLSSLYLYNYKTLTSIHNSTKFSIQSNVKVAILRSCLWAIWFENTLLFAAKGVKNERQMAKDLGIPMFVNFVDGKTVRHCQVATDTEASMEIKMAFFYAIQNTMQEYSRNASSLEFSSNGLWPTDYKTYRKKNDTFEISRTKLGVNYPDSKLQGNSTKHLNPLKFQKCHQVIKKQLIHSVECKESYSFFPVDRIFKDSFRSDRIENPDMATDISIKLEKTALKMDKSSRKKLTADLVVSNLNKPFITRLHQDFQVTIKEICTYSKDEIKARLPKTYQKLIHQLRQFSSYEFEKMYSNLEFTLPRCGKNNKARDIFFDALPAIGTPVALKVMVQLIHKRHSIFQARLWMTSLAFVSSPSLEAISEVRTLLDFEKFGKQAFAGISSMIRNYCQNFKCDNVPLINTIETSLKAMLGDHCTTSDKEKGSAVIASLKALGNIGRMNDALPTILECASSKDAFLPIRLEALKTLSKMPCSSEKIITEALSLFQDESEDDALRIEAYLNLMRCHSVEIIDTVIDQLQIENLNDVGDFVWTHLKNLRDNGKLNKEEKEHFDEEEEKIKGTFSARDKRLILNYEKQFYSEEANVNFNLEFTSFLPKVSKIPFYAWVNVTADIFGRRFRVLEFEGRYDGQYNPIEKLFGPDGILQKFKLARFFPNLTRGDISPYPDISPERSNTSYLSGSLSVFGREVIWENLEDVDDTKFEILMKVADQLKQLSEMRRIDVSKSLMFMDLAIPFATMGGQQFSFGLNWTATLGLKSEGVFDLTKLFTPERECHIEGFAIPSVALEISSSVQNGFAFESTTKTVLNIHASPRIDGSLKIKNGRIVHFKFNLPQDTSTIIGVGLNITDREVELRTSHSSEDSKCVLKETLDHYFGIRVCFIRTQHFFDASNAFAVSKIVLAKTDPTMTGYEFELAFPNTEQSLDKHFKIMFNTPNSTVSRHFLIEAKTEQKRPHVFFTEIRAVNNELEMIIRGKFASYGIRKWVLATVEINRREYFVFRAGFERQETPQGTLIVLPHLMLKIPYLSIIRLAGNISTHKERGELLFEFTSEAGSKPLYYLKAQLLGNNKLWSIASRELHINTNVTLLAPYAEVHSLAIYRSQLGKASSRVRLTYFWRNRLAQNISVNYELRERSRCPTNSDLWVMTETQSTEFPGYSSKIYYRQRYSGDGFRTRLDVDYEMMVRSGYRNNATFLLFLEPVLGENQTSQYNLGVLLNTSTLHFNSSMIITAGKNGHSPGTTFALKHILPNLLNSTRIQGHSIDLGINVTYKPNHPDLGFHYSDYLVYSNGSFKGLVSYSWRYDPKASLEYTLFISPDSPFYLLETTLSIPHKKILLRHDSFLNVTSTTVSFNLRTSNNNGDTYAGGFKLSTLENSQLHLYTQRWTVMLDSQLFDKEKELRFEVLDLEQPVASLIFLHREGLVILSGSIFWRWWWLGKEEPPSIDIKMASTLIASLKDEYRVTASVLFMNHSKIHVTGTLKPPWSVGPWNLTYTVQSSKHGAGRGEVSYVLKNGYHFLALFSYISQHDAYLRLRLDGITSRTSHEGVVSANFNMVSSHPDLKMINALVEYSDQRPDILCDLKTSIKGSGHHNQEYLIYLTYLMGADDFDGQLSVSSPFENFKSGRLEIAGAYNVNELRLLANSSLFNESALNLVLNRTEKSYQTSVHLSTGLEELKDLKVKVCCQVLHLFNVTLNGNIEHNRKNQATLKTASVLEGLTNTNLEGRWWGNWNGGAFGGESRYTLQKSEAYYGLYWREKGVEKFTLRTAVNSRTAELCLGAEDEPILHIYFLDTPSEMRDSKFMNVSVYGKKILDVETILQRNHSLTKFHLKVDVYQGETRHNSRIELNYQSSTSENGDFCNRIALKRKHRSHMKKFAYIEFEKTSEKFINHVGFIADDVDYGYQLDLLKSFDHSTSSCTLYLQLPNRYVKMLVKTHSKDSKCTYLMDIWTEYQGKPEAMINLRGEHAILNSSSVTTAQVTFLYKRDTTTISYFLKRSAESSKEDQSVVRLEVDQSNNGIVVYEAVLNPASTEVNSKIIHFRSFRKNSDKKYDSLEIISHQPDKDSRLIEWQLRLHDQVENTSSKYGYFYNNGGKEIAFIFKNDPLSVSFVRSAIDSFIGSEKQHAFSELIKKVQKDTNGSLGALLILQNRSLSRLWLKDENDLLIDIGIKPSKNVILHLLISNYKHCLLNEPEEPDLQRMLWPDKHSYLQWIQCFTIRLLAPIKRDFKDVQKSVLSYTRMFYRHITLFVEHNMPLQPVRDLAQKKLQVLECKLARISQTLRDKLEGMIPVNVLGGFDRIVAGLALPTCDSSGFCSMAVSGLKEVKNYLSNVSFSLSVPTIYMRLLSYIQMIQNDVPKFFPIQTLFKNLEHVVKHFLKNNGDYIMDFVGIIEKPLELLDHLKNDLANKWYRLHNGLATTLQDFQRKLLEIPGIQELLQDLTHFEHEVEFLQIKAIWRALVNTFEGLIAAVPEIGLVNVTNESKNKDYLTFGVELYDKNKRFLPWGW